MQLTVFPVIDLAATGANITRLRKEKGLSVRDMQAYFGFEEPQAIYKWQSGKSLPSVDNLYALGALLQVPMEDILVPTTIHMNCGQQDHSCCPQLVSGRLFRIRQKFRFGMTNFDRRHRKGSACRLSGTGQSFPAAQAAGISNNKNLQGAVRRSGKNRVFAKDTVCAGAV